MWACRAAETLWLLERRDHIDLVERCLRTKVVGPDFRSPMVDGRLALGWICALQGRDDEAHHWLAQARKVLAAQGAEPLLAIADFDEALMYLRSDDVQPAQALLQAARQRFDTIGMTGWMRRADEVAGNLK